MKYNFDYFLDLAKKQLTSPLRLVVTCPYDIDTIESIIECDKLGLIVPTLVGQQERINNAFKECNLTNNYETINCDNDLDACSITMDLLSSNKANFLMKGNIDTSTLLRVVLDKKYDLRTSRLMSHVCLSYNKNYDRFYIITDAAMNIKPDLAKKKKIIENAVLFANILGIEKPYVANLCAKEKVDQNIPETVDAFELQKMNNNGEIKNCVISGPLQIDLAIDSFGAEIKNCSDPVAGKANILMCPDINSANIFSKAICYLGD